MVMMIRNDYDIGNDDDEGNDDYDGGNDDDEGNDDDKYIMMKCLSVCHEKWSLPVTTWTTHNHLVQLQVSYDGSRLVFHGSMSVVIGFEGFRLVFHFSRSVFMFFKVPDWFFEVQG